MNHTLKDMVRCTMTFTSLPESLWGDTLKIAVYLLNRVPSKIVTKTSYEMWTGRKPSIRYLYVWGCSAKARSYRPNEKKLDSITVSYNFVSYSEKSRSYKFYDLSNKSFFKIGNTKFIEDGGSVKVRKISFEKSASDPLVVTTSAIISGMIVIPYIVDIVHPMRH